MHARAHGRRAAPASASVLSRLVLTVREIDVQVVEDAQYLEGVGLHRRGTMETATAPGRATQWLRWSRRFRSSTRGPRNRHPSSSRCTGVVARSARVRSTDAFSNNAQSKSSASGSVEAMTTTVVSMALKGRRRSIMGQGRPAFFDVHGGWHVWSKMAHLVTLLHPPLKGLYCRLVRLRAIGERQRGPIGATWHGSVGWRYLP